MGTALNLKIIQYRVFYHCADNTFGYHIHIQRIDLFKQFIMTDRSEKIRDIQLHREKQTVVQSSADDWNTVSFTF